jgi:hypothetical protein
MIIIQSLTVSVTACAAVQLATRPFLLDELVLLL